VAHVTVAEAADRLGVSQQRVRQLIAAQVLPAERVGARWLLDRAEVAKHEGPRPPGRPMSPRMAWGFLLALDGAMPDRLSGRERSRIERRLRRRPDVAEAAAWCRHRAVAHRLVGHPAAVARARVLPDVVLTGASADGPIIDVHGVDAYVRANGLRRARRTLALAPASPGQEANVVLRVPPSGLWPFVASRAGPATVAVDMWDAGEVRSRREARALFDRLVAEWLEAVGDED
jgi:excisionase family DNA binding protein